MLENTEQVEEEEEEEEGIRRGGFSEIPKNAPLIYLSTQNAISL